MNGARELTLFEVTELLEGEMTYWEQLERWLAGQPKNRHFTVYDVADELSVPVFTASGLIQAYLGAQRRSDSPTAYVLKREGRTRAAIWSRGERRADAHIIGGMLFDDVRTKVIRAFKPDLERLADLNPNAASYAEAKIVAVMDGALRVLAASVDTGFGDDGAPV